MRISLSATAVHPLLFAAYAVLFLHAENVQLVRPTETLLPLVATVGGAAALLLALTAVLRDMPRAGLVASAAVVVFFGYGHVAGLIGANAAADAAGWPLLLAWSALIGGICGLLLLRRSLLPRLTSGLNVAGLVLVLFALATIVPSLSNVPARAQGNGFEPTGHQPTRSTQRDIYYIVPDRYGSASSLAAGFGITDNDLPGWLEQRGFAVARESYANYSRTALSMAAVLNVTHLDEIAARQGARSTDYGPVYEMLQEHLVGRFLREQGYRYVHIGSWFNPTRSVRIADENLESDSATEFQAVFEQTTALPLLRRTLAQEEQMPPEDEKHVQHAQFQFRAIHRVIDEPGPKFVLLHVLLPHDPYTFDEDGEYVPPSARRGVPVADQFRAQLAYTNDELKGIVERLLDRPAEEQPIIIIQADEGPYPARYDADELGFDWSQATPAELETKFGILNAVYLPDEAATDGEPAAGRPDFAAQATSINTFRLLLEHYFGLRLPALADRVYVSASPPHPYDLTDVTDLLPGPAD